MSKILFIRGGAVGDFILTLPAIQLAREQLPDAGIEVLGYPPITRLAEAAGLADATRSIEYGPLSSFFVPDSVLAPELMDYFASFSVVISYLYDPDGFFEANLRRCGVETLFCGPHRVEDGDPAAPHAATQLAAPLERLALFLQEPFVSLRFDDASRRAADTFFGGAAATEDGRWVALHPGSGSPRKNWSFEGWVKVAAALRAQDSELRFLITSGEAEDAVIGEFVGLLEAANVRYVRATHLPLPELGVILQRCSVYLGHDSGISHLAAACGIPCVLLFGPTEPLIWAPRNPKVVTLKAPRDELSKMNPEVVAKAARVLLGESD